MLHFPNNKGEQVPSVQHRINCRREESQISKPEDTTIREKAANPFHLSRRKAISFPQPQDLCSRLAAWPRLLSSTPSISSMSMFKAALHIVELAGIPRAL